MPLVKVKVQQCVQDSQEYGSTDEHMVSRVFFTIGAVDGPNTEDTCDVKQVVGSAYSSDNMEVGHPHKYRGPYDHGIFSKEIGGYFSNVINSSGSVIVASGGSSVRMKNVWFKIPYEFEFNAEPTEAGW